MKKGATDLVGAKQIWLYVSNYFIIFGLISAVIAAVSWIKALQKYHLSYAYPFMSLSFLLVAVLSAYIFGETIKMAQWIGLLVVITGLIIGSL